MSLEDLYKGKTTKLAVKKHVYQYDPNGQYQTNRGQRMSRNVEKKKVDLTIDRGMMVSFFSHLAFYACVSFLASLLQ